MSGRTKLTVAYLGTPFHGWQRQPHRRTVQGELEGALKRMLGGLEVTVSGAGRTDAGVHAAGQVVHLELPVEIPAGNLCRALNAILPTEIRVRSARSVGDAFDARRSAVAKLYTYRVRWRAPTLPWVALRSATLPRVADLGRLAGALARLEGTHDVASFSPPILDGRSTRRTLYALRASSTPGGLRLDFLGDGFLRYQVRRMVGAVLEIGRRRLSLGELDELLERPTPGAPLPTAPARGLTLEHVYYRLPKGRTATDARP